jgi:hypothetical protein
LVVEGWVLPNFMAQAVAAGIIAWSLAPRAFSVFNADLCVVYEI